MKRGRYEKILYDFSFEFFITGDAYDAGGRFRNAGCGLGGCVRGSAGECRRLSAAGYTE